MRLRRALDGTGLSSTTALSRIATREFFTLMG
jgi:hypothetical protein